MGKPGYITTPSAAWFEDTDLGFSFAYIARDYTEDILASGTVAPALNKLNLYSVRASITKFFDVNLSIAYRPEIKKRIGVGDRQLDFRFRIFKETQIRPTLVLGITPPGSVSPVMGHDYLVATKHFPTIAGRFEVSIGYGSPFLISGNSLGGNFLKSLRLRKKEEFRNNQYLSGFFGGFSYMPVNFAGLMAEYNTSTFNTGIFFKLDDRFYIQAYTFEFQEVGFSFSANFPLDLAPHTLRRYEKNRK